MQTDRYTATDRNTSNPYRGQNHYLSYIAGLWQ